MKMKCNRYDLEDYLVKYVNSVEETLDILIYMIGDCKRQPTEDELLNVLIGHKDSLKYEHKRLWDCFEALVHDKKIVTDTTEADVHKDRRHE